MFTTALCLLSCFVTILCRILSLFSPRMKMRENLSIINCRTTHARHVLLLLYHCCWIRFPSFLMIYFGLLIYGVIILIYFMWIQLQKTSVLLNYYYFLLNNFSLRTKYHWRRSKYILKSSQNLLVDVRIVCNMLQKHNMQNCS